jgi:hypothetical protein
MLRGLTIVLTLMVITLGNSCNNTPLHNSNDSESARAGEPIKGELAFLLSYNGEQPDSVGFFSNQIMSRRLHNLLKSDYDKFAINLTHCTNVLVDTPFIIVSGSAVNPKDINGSSAISINVLKDAIAVAYRNADSTKVYEEQPEVKQHDLFEEYIGLPDYTEE